MGNKSMQDQSALNDYERSKRLRVQENKEKLRSLGLNNIAKSVTSLVESQKTKKRKNKPSGDNEQDHEEEEATSVGVSKTKLHRPQYIAPMSMNRYANLAKQRVNAPNVPHVLPFKECRMQKGHPMDSNAAIQSRMQESMGGQKRNGHLAYTNATKKNQSSEKELTMGELMLKKKGPLKQKESFKQNLERHNSVTTRIRSGPQRKLLLVDNDEDRAADMRLHVMNEVQEAAENDEIEDIENLISESDQNGIQQDDMICQGFEDDVNEAYNEGSDDDVNEAYNKGSEDDVNEDMDDSEDELEDENEGVVQERNEACFTTKKRGPTMMHSVHVRDFNARPVIICNERGQPVGPVTKEIDIVGQFSRFLGTIARIYSHAPLTYDSWHKVPNKERIWEYVLEKYIVPDDAKPWVLMSIGASWRGHKCRLKKNHFYRFKDNKTRWKNRPQYIPDEDFSKLLISWNKEAEKIRCSLKRKVRMSQKNMHTAGPKSFARIREEMKNEDPNKESPNLTNLFERTRQRTEGRVYVDTFDDTAKKIEQMKNYKPREDGSAQIDPFFAVMNKGYNAHRSLCGKGVSNKVLKKLNGGETSYMVPSEVVDLLKADVEAGKSKLVDMQRQFAEEHERMKIELAEEHERKKAELQSIQKDIDSQRDKLVEDAVQKLLEKLPRQVFQKYFM